jgi:hypothetical protein
MKKIIFLIGILLPFLSSAQGVKTAKATLDHVNNSYFMDLNEYTSGSGNQILRNSSLDSFAEVRLNYYMSLMEEAVNSGKSLKEAVRQIPYGSTAHSRYFGNPEFFREGNVKYTDLNIKIKKENAKVVSEIMQNRRFTFWSSDLMSIEDVYNEYAETYYSKNERDFILRSYLKSSGHKGAIDRHGIGRTGSCTKVLMTKIWKDQYKKWEYTILIENVTVFSEKIKE